MTYRFTKMSTKTVGDLKKLLEQFPDNLPLITSKPPGGDGYRFVQCEPREVYVDCSTPSTHEVETVFTRRELLQEFENDGLTPEEFENELKYFCKVVVLD